MIVVSSRIAGLILPRRYSAMCIWPFVLVRKGIHAQEKTTLLNHERIHARQQLEMLLVGFFLWYGVEYLVRLLCLRQHGIAYHSISFEKEAFANDQNMEYLKKRKPFSWMAYL
ncbi:MAG: hypothetical protein JXQ80_01810 [Bacteroidales bacterium]|nr:hypothetical protein [Bacteroidales bacterium]